MPMEREGGPLRKAGATSLSRRDAGATKQKQIPRPHSPKTGEQAPEDKLRAATCRLVFIDRFIEVVVPIVFRTLQGQLEGDAIFSDLVNPYARGNFNGARERSAGVAGLGRSIGLRGT